MVRTFPVYACRFSVKHKRCAVVTRVTGQHTIAFGLHRKNREFLLWCEGSASNDARFGLFCLVRGFEAQIFLDDLRHIFFSDFHIPKPFGPDHHVRTERADVQTAASDHANLALEISFRGNFPELLDNCFGTAETAGWALALAVVGADMKLSDIGLLPFDHEPPLK